MDAAPVLLSLTLLKAGDDNSRWKRRYFQLIPGRLQYFENERDALKHKPFRGEMRCSEIIGLAIFSRSNHPTQDAALQACASLTTSQHEQQGPIKLMIWTRNKLWRLQEDFGAGQNSSQSNSIDDKKGTGLNHSSQHVTVDKRIGELIRALDRQSLVTKISCRAAGWMKAQGTLLAWNRRYAVLLSSGDLLLFVDASLENMRRRIVLSKALDIRPLQPLAPAESSSEKRVVRALKQFNSGEYSMEVSNLQEGYELVGIRLRHPDIPEKRGYVMCVEAEPNEDATEHYARFRRWIVQLQLSAAESRLSGFSPLKNTSGVETLSAENEEGLERKLLNIVASCSFTTLSRDTVVGSALPYLVHMRSFPALWRGPIWFTVSGGSYLKRTWNSAYRTLALRGSASSSSFSLAQALEDDSPDGTLEESATKRLRRALLQLDPRIRDEVAICELFLNHMGEESAFWTMASLTCSTSITPQSQSKMLLWGFFQPGFARHVEARVVLDLLGLWNPNLLAHLSAYDLSSCIVKNCVSFFTTCMIPQIWDAVCVLGKDGFVFAAVCMLTARKAEFLNCFSIDEADRVAKQTLHDVSYVSSVAWRELDVQVIEELRRAQWATIVDLMHDHQKYISAWKATALEVSNMAIKTVSYCNRLSSTCELSMEEEFCLEQAHGCAIELKRKANDVSNCTDLAERVLDLEIRRAMGSVAAEASSTLLLAFETSDARSLSELGNSLNTSLMAFGWCSLAFAWQSWVKANRRVFTNCRFVPKVFISNGVASASLPLTQAVVKPDWFFSNNNSAAVAAAVTSTQMSVNYPPAISSSAVRDESTGGGGGGLIGLPDEAHGTMDSSTFRSIAMGLGKRLQQRFLNVTSSNNNNNNRSAASSLSNLSSIMQDGISMDGIDSTVSESLNNRTMDRLRVQNSKSPLAGASTFPTMNVAMGFDKDAINLVSRYRGGFLGLIDVAGSALDAALARDEQTKDSMLIPTLHMLDAFLSCAMNCESSIRSIVLREQPTPAVDVPLDTKRFFVSTSTSSFDQEEFKAYQDCLRELCARACAG